MKSLRSFLVRGLVCLFNLHGYMTFVGMSDDLVLPEVSYSSSAALAYERIQQRLNGIVSKGEMSPLKHADDATSLSGSVVDMDTDGAGEHSGDTASTFKQFAQDTASFALPAGATSTPMRSTQMPSDMQLHSSQYWMV